LRRSSGPREYLSAPEEQPDNLQLKFQQVPSFGRLANEPFIQGSGGVRKAVWMVRNIAIAGLAAVMLGCLPAHGQEGEELEGAPGWQKAEKHPPVQNPIQKKPAVPAAQTQTPAQAQAAADRIKADQAKLAQQAEAQRAEQARLAQQAADLKAQQARLEARAAELAAEERRLAQLRSDQESAQAIALARRRGEAGGDEGGGDEAAREEALRSQRQTADLAGEANGARSGGYPDRDAPTETRRPGYARLDYNDARRSCARAGENAALARDFYSARYETEPRFYQDRGWELRGLMRLDDRRGYVLVDAVCRLDAEGEVQRFRFLR